MRHEPRLSLEKTCFACRHLKTVLHKDGSLAYLCGKIQLELADLIMGAEPCKDFEPAPKAAPSAN